MIILLKILLAHFLGDFLLQPKSWVRAKEKNKLRSPQLYIHILLHGLLILLLLWNLQYWIPALLIMLAHGLIDVLKLYSQNETNKSQWFFLDQLFHLLSIFIIYFLWFRPSWTFLPLLQNRTFWTYLLTVVFITIVTSIIIQKIMQKWSNQLKNTGIALESAGNYIGIIERVLIFLFITLGQWAAVGFLLAAKSVFRFGDLRESKDRQLTEYILIGTFLSFGIAIVTTIVANLIVHV